MPVDTASSLEVGLVGSEGMFGIPLALGVDVSPVRGRRPGRRARAAHGRRPFSRELKRRGAVEYGMDRYAFVQLTQLAQAAACTRFHVVESRLARWLLMTQDCAHSDSFHITQEFLAFDARSSPGRRHQGGQRPAGARPHSSTGAATSRCSTARGLKAAACGCYRGGSRLVQADSRLAPPEWPPSCFTPWTTIRNSLQRPGAFRRMRSPAVPFAQMPIQREPGAAPVHRSPREPCPSGSPLPLPFPRLQLGRQLALRPFPVRSMGDAGRQFRNPAARASAARSCRYRRDGR